MEEGESFSAKTEDSPFDEQELSKHDYGEGNVDEYDDVHSASSTEEASTAFGIGIDGDSPAGAYASQEKEKEEELAERPGCHSPEVF